MKTLLSRFHNWRLRSTSLLAVLLWQMAVALTPEAHAAIGGGADTTSTTLSSDTISAYIADKTLLIASKQVKLQQLGDKATLPSRNSKTFQYTRYERLALPTSVSSWDPALTKINGRWHLAFVESPAQQPAFVFHPALAAAGAKPHG